MKNGGVMSFDASSSLSGIANFFLTAISDRNGIALTITRDSGRNITEMSSVSGKLSFSVDFNTGRIQKITDQGRRSVSYQYDAAGRLIKVIDPLGQEMSYTYDANNQLLTTSNQRGIVDASRTYDANGRITQEQYADGSVMQFVYTLINDTAPEPKDTATDTATVNALNQYTTLNGKPVAHDDNGNQTINSAVWDARDRLVSLTGPNFTALFTYDALGRRSSKTVNGQKKTYLYDGSDLISETGAEYTFGPGIDEPLERKSGQKEYYLSDALGSVIGLTDSNGAIKTSYNYSPFGKKQATGASSDNPFTFTGREDDGTGYYYYRARYYSPDPKRFIAEDPAEFSGGDINLQAYVGNNPVNATDPSGLRSPELTSLLQTVCAKKIKQACDDYPQAPSYGQSLANAEAEFYNIADKSTIEVRSSEKYGYIETGKLLGGGKCTLRPGGSSGIIPTIDLQEDQRVGHNPPGYEKVGEIKFKYRGNESNAIQTKIIPTPSTPLERLGNFLQNLVAPFIPSKRDINSQAY
jgi:RHS repeat-associated protein